MATLIVLVWKYMVIGMIKVVEIVSYANSVIQALHSCKPFRDAILRYQDRPPKKEIIENENDSSEEENRSRRKRMFSKIRNVSHSSDICSTLDKDSLLYETFVLFEKMSNMKKKGTCQPSTFIQRVRAENEIFNNTMHHDAHEFLIFLLNSLMEQLLKIKAKSQSSEPPPKTWVQSLFEGVLTNETKCITCETITHKDENFFDLSLEIEPKTSINYCLKKFSSSEILSGRNKFYCDECCSLQEAEKRMKIKKSPQVLIIHLKRFKYDERLSNYTKLSYNVCFTQELRLFNVIDWSESTDQLYKLSAIVIHIGSALNHGHYISIVLSEARWIVCDDENVRTIDEEELDDFFGGEKSNSCAYLLFYQIVNS